MSETLGAAPFHRKDGAQSQVDSSRERRQDVELGELIAHETVALEQIHRRVAGEDHLREDGDLGAGGLGSGRCLFYELPISGQVSDRRVQLDDGKAHGARIGAVLSSVNPPPSRTSFASAHCASGSPSAHCASGSPPARRACYAGAMPDDSVDIIGPSSSFYISQRLKLHYVDWGNESAPPMLLIHGGRDHARSWDWVARDCAATTT